MKTRNFIIIGILILVISLLRSFFIIDFRYFKEEFLIKRNYNKNIDLFNKASQIFKNFPTLTINFDFDKNIDINFEKNLIKKNNEPSFCYDYYSPTISVYDTVLYFNNQNFSSQILDFMIEDSNLKIILLDSVLNTNTEKVKFVYSGKMKSDKFQEILKLADLKMTKIERIKDELRKFNCFGYSKFSNGELILNYRTDGINSFSYLFANNDSIIEKIDNDIGRHGKIKSDIYWIQIGNQLVDYIPYLKLKNKEI
jgi:hypothetical protein